MNFDHNLSDIFPRWRLARPKISGIITKKICNFKAFYTVSYHLMLVSFPLKKNPPSYFILFPAPISNVMATSIIENLIKFRIFLRTSKKILDFLETFFVSKNIATRFITVILLYHPLGSLLRCYFIGFRLAILFIF